jgi:imidazoleglycerol-phosphate dehydratase / histidinol-phosphatase
MKKSIFIETHGGLLTPDGNAFQPLAIQTLVKLTNETEFALVRMESAPLRHEFLSVLKSEGITFAETLNAAEPSDLLKKYLDLKYDLPHSVCVTGDAESEMSKTFQAFGVSTLIMHTEKNWQAIYNALQHTDRKATLHRKTSETDIRVDLNLDGTGAAHIATGIGFFDHLLEQIPRHGRFDLTLIAKGDLHIEAHHTIEDVAIAFGETFLKALGTKRGIERYAFLLPMDETLAQIAIDFSGRNFLVWDAAFTRENIGELPTEMIKHFFRSFSDAAKCNLNIKLTGENDHHQIEGLFKAFARVLRDATRRDGSTIPSTKGVL